MTKARYGLLSNDNAITGLYYEVFKLLLVFKYIWNRYFNTFDDNEMWHTLTCKLWRLVTAALCNNCNIWTRYTSFMTTNFKDSLTFSSRRYDTDCCQTTMQLTICDMKVIYRFTAQLTGHNNGIVMCENGGTKYTSNSIWTWFEQRTMF